MQARLGQIHETIKTFGENGSPLRHCFWKQVKRKQIKEHSAFLVKEVTPKLNSKLGDDILDALVQDKIKEMSKDLRYRGYFIKD